MKPEREMAVEAMRNLGWRAEKDTSGRHPKWKFSRADTGGLWDVCSCAQSDLSMSFVASMALAYGDAKDLRQKIEDAKEEWLRSRFFGMYQRREMSQ